MDTFYRNVGAGQHNVNLLPDDMCYLSRLIANKALEQLATECCYKQLAVKHVLEFAELYLTHIEWATILDAFARVPQENRAEFSQEVQKYVERCHGKRKLEATLIQTLAHTYGG